MRLISHLGPHIVHRIQHMCEHFFEERHQGSCARTCPVAAPSVGQLPGTVAPVTSLDVEDIASGFLLMVWCHPLQVRKKDLNLFGGGR